MTPAEASVSVQSNSDGRLCAVTYGVVRTWRASGAKSGRIPSPPKRRTVTAWANVDINTNQTTTVNLDLAIDYGCGRSVGR